MAKDDKQNYLATISRKVLSIIGFGARTGKGTATGKVTLLVVVPPLNMMAMMSRFLSQSG